MTIFKIAGFTFLLFCLSCREAPQKDNATSAVSTLNNVSLYTLENDPIDMQQYKGKTVFINFWATWCKPCIREMPSIQKAMEILKEEDIVFLFATNDDLAAVKAFKNENEYDFEYVQVKNPEALEIESLPTTLIYDSEGALRFSESGYRKWDKKRSVDQILEIHYNNDK